MQSTTVEWYKHWFDTSYYHILYQHRNEQEAYAFIQQLARVLAFKPGQTALDLACGRGRHALYLSQHGLDVTGVDLSAASIAFAQQFAHNKLRFFVHDMREPFAIEHFDYVFNLFTSFGYFDTTAENLKVLHAIYQSLKPKGQLLIDFLNASYVRHNIVKQETKQLDDIVFHINRSISGDFVIKDICFEHNNKAYHFQEKVQLLSLEDFLQLFDKTNFRLVNVWGNYCLENYDPNHSARLIMQAEKIG